MKVFTASQIRAGDAYTIEKEPVKSIDLMERAANRCAVWIREQYPEKTSFHIFCGTGNNGGDGLALTRILQNSGLNAHAYIILYSAHFSPDCSMNRKRLEHSFGSRIHAVYSGKDLPDLPSEALIVDALFGTGLNRPLKGLPKDIVNKINTFTNDIVAIDMPSGLQAEQNTPGTAVVKATHTLSFEFYKLAFLFPENAVYTGKVHLLPIGIHPEYISKTPTPFRLITKEYVKHILIRRNAFSHKGNYGHALIIAGSYGKMGAAVLATKATLRAGAGLVTSNIPRCGYSIMQTAVPEAMCICDKAEDYLARFEGDPDVYNAIGTGPGIGTRPETADFLKSLLSRSSHPLILDADALNLISKDNRLLALIPKGSVLTPHPGEFKRLFGETVSSYQRLQLQLEKSRALDVTILLKGHHTCITTPSGQAWFNTTGNAGMATGGSGDVLTGLLTGLLAQSYTPDQAAILGTWLHGAAGDIGAKAASMESLTASDLVRHMGAAFQDIIGNSTRS